MVKCLSSSLKERREGLKVGGAYPSLLEESSLVEVFKAQRVTHYYQPRLLLVPSQIPYPDVNAYRSPRPPPRGHYRTPPRGRRDFRAGRRAARARRLSGPRAVLRLRAHEVRLQYPRTSAREPLFSNLERNSKDTYSSGGVSRRRSHSFIPLPFPLFIHSSHFRILLSRHIPPLSRRRHSST